MNRRPPERPGLVAVDPPSEAREKSTGKLFEELAVPVLDELYGFACRLERDRAAAADLLQDSLLTGFRKFSQLETASSFRTWMATIVRRTFYNRRRRRDHTVRLVEEMADETLDLSRPRRSDGVRPDERLVARRLSRELKEALDHIPRDQRLAVYLVDVRGTSYAEAATILGTPPGTVASRVARGRDALRARLHHLAKERGWA